MKNPIPAELNRFLPFDYVKIIHKQFQGRYSESLIIKVKSGERQNLEIREAIIDLASKHKEDHDRVSQKESSLVTT